MRRFPVSLSAAGYAPVPKREVVRNTFDAMGDGGVLNDVIADLSFPRDPRTQLMARGGTASLCRHCYLLPEDHQSPAAQAGYEPLGTQTPPGVHPDVDDGSAHNAADELYADSRSAEFGVGRGSSGW